MTPQVISLSAAGSTAWIPVDYKQNPFNIDVAVVLSNTPNLTYKVEYTLDNVFNTLITPTAFSHTILVSLTTDRNASLTYPVRAIRLTITSWTSGTATLTALQGSVNSDGTLSPDALGAKLGSTSITYDSTGKVATHDSWVVTYNSNGRITSQTNGAVIQTFNYNSNGQFTGITES